MTSVRYTLVHLDPDDETPAVLGDVEIEPGRIELLGAEPGCLEFLNELLDDIEANRGVVLKVPGAERYSLEAEHHAVTDPDFVDALREWLEQRFGIELRSTAELRPELLGDLTG